MTLSKHVGIRPTAWGLALAVFVLGGLWAQSATAASPTSVVSYANAGSAAKAKKIRHYWTPRRMRHADPLDVQVSPGEVARAARKSGSAATRRGHPVTIPPSGPKGSPSGTRVPMATVINDPTVFPYRTQGKLFFQQGSGSYVCSATVVNTPTKRVIFSAGHCIVDEGQVSRNVAFVPGYHNGVRPYGTFVASKTYSIQGWIQQGDFRYDISAAVLRGTQAVANVVGSRGIKWNLPRQQTFVSYGYPAASPFNGEQLYKCPSPFRGLDSGPAPQPQWITCNMTGGSSGGGWIVQNAYLNSVNSYGYTNQPGRMYGPYFGSAAANLYNGVKNQAP